MAGSDEIRAFDRRVSIPNLIVTYVFWFVVAHLLWSLCRNIEQRHIFTEKNLELIRMLGAVIILAAIVQPIVRSWADTQVAEFVTRHASFDGLTVLRPAGEALFRRPFNFFGIQIYQLITGVLVLLLAEVFRQGLVLKQDADLTV